MRSAVLATPSQVWGFPSQHQPSLGARPEIHSAGTRRSPRREPESMKQAFFSRICGWSSTSGNALGDRQRGATAGLDDRQGVLRGYAAELLTSVHVQEGVHRGRWGPDRGDRTVGRQALRPVVAVQHPGRRTPGQAQQRHLLLGCGHLPIHAARGDQDEGTGHPPACHPRASTPRRSQHRPQRLDGLGELLERQPEKSRECRGRPAPGPADPARLAPSTVQLGHARPVFSPRQVRQ